jgi:hypothetical protein
MKPTMLPCHYKFLNLQNMPLLIDLQKQYELVISNRQLHNANLFSTGVDKVLWFYGGEIRSNTSTAVSLDCEGVKTQNQYGAEA